MGFRFRKRIKIAPGIKLNLSKSGPSLSLGGRGFTENIGRRGRRTTVSLPGTGLSYVTQQKRRQAKTPARSPSTNTPSSSTQTWQWTEGRGWRRAGMVLLVGGFVLALTPAWALGILCLFAGALILLYWGVRGIGAKSQWKRDQAERSASDEPL